MKKIAFIFARGGSKGLPNKNTLDFCGKPLIAHTIHESIASEIFDDVVVSTDDQVIAKIAREYGATVPFERPKELACDDSDEWQSWKHAIETYRDDFDIFISLPCTSPLREYSDISSMIDKYKNINCDAVIGITKSNHNPSFNMVNKNSEGVISLLEKSDNNIFRRQDFGKCYNITTYAYVCNPQFIQESKNLLSGKIYGYELEKRVCVDIDDIDDFKFAEFLQNNKGNN